MLPLENLAFESEKLKLNKNCSPDRSTRTSMSSSSNIAIVSPLPMSYETITLYDDACDFIQMNIKQEPEVFDVDSAPSPIEAPSPMPICQVTYDSIYDDYPMFFWNTNLTIYT